ncbi:MAG: hypothetical protein ABSF70_02000 [Terracidiphilus sp.]|jgi:hypothetical protein
MVEPCRDRAHDDCKKHQPIDRFMKLGKQFVRICSEMADAFEMDDAARLAI